MDPISASINPPEQEIGAISNIRHNLALESIALVRFFGPSIIIIILSVAIRFFLDPPTRLSVFAALLAFPILFKNTVKYRIQKSDRISAIRNLNYSNLRQVGILEPRLDGDLVEPNEWPGENRISGRNITEDTTLTTYRDATERNHRFEYSHLKREIRFAELKVLMGLFAIAGGGMSILAVRFNWPPSFGFDEEPLDAVDVICTICLAILPRVSIEFVKPSIIDRLVAGLVGLLCLVSSFLVMIYGTDIFAYSALYTPSIFSAILLFPIIWHRRYMTRASNGDLMEQSERESGPFFI
jgi:hypothetical protein